MGQDDTPPKTKPEDGHTHIGGPGFRVARPDVPEVYTAPTLALSLPASLFANAHPAEVLALNIIQIEYAERVAETLASSYRDVLNLLRSQLDSSRA